MQKQICKLLAQGHTIKTVCEAVAIGERTYFDWCGKHPHFSQATTCAIGKSKIVLVDKLRLSDDWRAAAFLLERRWPDEFGRCDVRPLPKEPEPERQGPRVCFILSLPDGTQRESSFEELQKMFATFPRRETCEPPAEEGKSFPGPEPESELLDANTELGSDGS
jgi:hypothetical protein